MKEKVKLLLGEVFFYKIRDVYIVFKSYLEFFLNFVIDAFLYFKYSNVFIKTDSLKKIEALVILKYHSLEKGLLHKNMKYRFGKDTVRGLIKLLNRKNVIENKEESQFFAAYTVICKYYELHQKEEVDISDFYSYDIYEKFNSFLNKEEESVINHFKEAYFNESKKDFFDFSKSRSSVRDYTGELIDVDIIEKVIELSKRAPSVCNRQPVKVYCVSDKEKVKTALGIQGGLRGYDEKINQLLIVTSDRNYFYTIGERNQLYIDGGIFLMNLLYSLHYYNIAACPAHWGMVHSKERKIHKLLNISNSEKIISFVTIGVPKEEFRTCLSKRRENKEIVEYI